MDRAPLARDLARGTTRWERPISLDRTAALAARWAGDAVTEVGYHMLVDINKIIIKRYKDNDSIDFGLLLSRLKIRVIDTEKASVIHP